MIGIKWSQVAANPNAGRAIGLDVQIRSLIRNAGLQILPELLYARPWLGPFGMMDEPSLGEHI
jgi:hypothetical protein